MQDVYISGLGIITSIGSHLATFWKALCTGTTGVGPVTRFDTHWLPTHIAAEIKDFDNLPYLPSREAAGLSKAMRLGISVTRQALADAGLLSAQGGMSYPEMDFFLGTVRGELFEFISSYIQAKQKRAGPLGAEFIPQRLWIDNPIYGILPKLASYLGCRGQQSLVTNSCAAGSYAITLGAERIRQGKAQIALCGAVDVMAEPDYIGFCSLRALAPERCQPFDIHRQGLVLGEAAAMLVLESEASLARRQKQPWARLAGYGWSCDGYHLSAPHPQGLGVKLCLQRAIQDAELLPHDIGCIIAHGTGTPSNDAKEAQAIQAVFADASPWVTAPKSMLGHAVGAASAVEAVIGILTLAQGKIPPTINLEQLDPACPIKCVTGSARTQKLKACLTNSSGFGGNNASLIFMRDGDRQIND